MLSGSIQIHSSVSTKIKSCNLIIQNLQIFMDDQCNYKTYTCFIYNQLWFIDHPTNTLSYSIFHNLKSIQLCSQIQFSYAVQFSSENQFSYANQFNYANQFSYALNEFNLCLRYTGYQSHWHGPAGLQAGITWFYNTVRSRWAADWL